MSNEITPLKRLENISPVGINLLLAAALIVLFTNFEKLKHLGNVENLIDSDQSMRSAVSIQLRRADVEVSPEIQADISKNTWPRIELRVQPREQEVWSMRLASSMIDSPDEVFVSDGNNTLNAEPNLRTKDDQYDLVQVTVLSVQNSRFFDDNNRVLYSISSRVVVKIDSGKHTGKIANLEFTTAGQEHIKLEDLTNAYDQSPFIGRIKQ